MMLSYKNSLQHSSLWIYHAKLHSANSFAMYMKRRLLIMTRNPKVQVCFYLLHKMWKLLVDYTKGHWEIRHRNFRVTTMKPKIIKYETNPVVIAF